MRVVDVGPGGLSDFLRGGREKAAEENIIKLFSRGLDDHYIMLRNLVLPETNEKLGLVLVGPTGVWHIELLHLASLSQNGPVWMYWDYEKQGIQVVPFNTLATQARSRLAELRAFLSPDGIPAYQVVMVPMANIPRDFIVPGVEQMLYVEDIADFVRTRIKAAGEASVNVGRAVDLLTGKVPRKVYAQPLAVRQPGWLQRHHPWLGNLTGLQLLLVGALAAVNLCLLLSLGALLLLNF
ncbi:MAG: NERD domain-containing protein [Anaerolineales bacterium]|nr:NERD domain-containing protein [Anaerolineales bacterium]